MKPKQIKAFIPHQVNNKLIEIGSVNCAGLYVSDMAKMVEAASKIAEREWLECNS